MGTVHEVSESDTTEQLTLTFHVCINMCVCVCVCVCVCMSCHVTEKAMAPHSGTLAWETPWTEEPGRVQSMGSRRVGHD